MGGWFEPIADAIAAGRLVIVSSDDLHAELSDVLSRPRISRWVSSADAVRVLDFHLHAAMFVEPEPEAETKVCRDASDNYLLALAGASEADVLVTRDEDLLALGHYEATQIVYPAKFLHLLAGMSQNP